MESLSRSQSESEGIEGSPHVDTVDLALATSSHRSRASVAVVSSTRRLASSAAFAAKTHWHVVRGGELLVTWDAAALHSALKVNENIRDRVKGGLAHCSRVQRKWGVSLSSELRVLEYALVTVTEAQDDLTTALALAQAREKLGRHHRGGVRRAIAVPPQHA